MGICGLCDKEIKSDEGTVLFKGQWLAHSKCAQKHLRKEVEYFRTK